MDRAAEDRRRYEEELSKFKTLYGKAYGKNVEINEMKDDNQLREEDIEAIIIAEEEEAQHRQVSKMAEAEV